MQSRRRFSFLLTAFLFLFLGSCIWSLVIDPTAPALAWPQIGLQLSIIACYVCWWFVLSSLTNRARTGPIPVLWHITLTGFLFLFLLVPVLAIPGASTWELDSPVPTAILKQGLIGLLTASFSCIMLLRLRTLVRRRRQVGGRNWRRMVYAVVGFSLYLPHVGQVSNESVVELLKLILLIVLGGAAVAYIAANAFRVSWIVQMRGRQKWLSMLLGSVLLALILFLLAIATDSWNPQILGISWGGYGAFVWSYSPSLAVFAMLCFSFGLLYTLSSVLSLLFNVPTSADVRLTVDEMGVLDNLTSLMQSAVGIDEVAERIVEQTVEGYDASAAWIAVLDYQQAPFQPRITALQGISLEKANSTFDTNALFNEVANSKEVLIIQQAATDFRVSASLGGGMDSLAIAPLGDGTDVSGALFIVRDVAYGFEKDDIAAIRMLTSHASLALEYARLVESTIEQERLERELAIAREVQLRLLPQALPESAGMSVAASSAPAQEVGGDFYDMIRLSNGNIALIVADVSGKGTSAAFYMAILQGIFRSAARVAADPRDFLLQANQALNDCLDKKVFVTAVYGLIDMQAQCMYVARAGHCPAICINADGDLRQWRSSGLGLGLSGDDLLGQSLDVVRHEFSPEDVIVLYTDGLIENRNSEGEEYGIDRLTQAVKHHRQQGARGLHDALIENLAKFTGDQPSFADDLTLMVLKWHGTQPAASLEAADQL